jgi:hypothetical protein
MNPVKGRLSTKLAYGDVHTYKRNGEIINFSVPYINV